MISFIYLVVFVFCSAAAVEQAREVVTAFPSSTEDVARRELTDTGYMIRYGDALYRYPPRIVPIVRRVQTGERNPTETNEIETGEDNRRPLFYFMTYEATNLSDSQALPASRPYIEIRRKRDVETSEVPESSKVAKLRRKRTYCGKCGGGGGYGGYYAPVTYAVYPVYPVYYTGYGGGAKGKGCNTCGHGGGYGGGGGSYSYSSSSAQSSSGSYGWGKK